ncbi:MmpS family transport accessory protein [Mycobacteroides immunogenum]|uniref:MmpS family transport accessory protein n=1 Tax=Mycobacteroides immunogenum TaxID=83262 RepID=UPI0025B764DF|nr:MmpS family transport accessory protein [Mycobacteroides immunogenum]WJR34804.1 MmpS family transport accessory protein [Mycobacteroides immunogenum]
MRSAKQGRRYGRRIVGQLWPLAVAVVVLGVSGFVVVRIREMNEEILHPPLVDNDIPAAVRQINPKDVSYEVFGDLGDGGKVTYANLDSEPVEVVLTSLPWSVSETTMSPGASLSLVGQVEGKSIGCRIVVNGKVLDEQVVNHDSAAVSCTVTAA